MKPARGAVWAPPPRYVHGGHRAPDEHGRSPRRSRDFPPWLWPFELIDRAHAALMRWAPAWCWEGLDDPPRDSQPTTRG